MRIATTDATPLSASLPNPTDSEAVKSFVGSMNVPEPEWTHSELKQRYWKHSGVPELHAQNLDKVLSHNDEREEKWARALKAVEDAIEGGGISALLGPRGTGKTQMAVWIIRDWCLNEGMPALYRRAGDIFTSIRKTYDLHGTTCEAEIISRLTRVALLIIDEIHERAGSDFESRTLTQILDNRYAARKPTLLLSNELPDAFSESVGPSVADRIRETGKVIVCKWESYRTQLTSVVQVIE